MSDVELTVSSGWPKLGRWYAPPVCCDSHESVVTTEDTMFLCVNHYSMKNEVAHSQIEVCRKCGSLFVVRFNDDTIGKFVEEQEKNQFGVEG